MSRCWLFSLMYCLKAGLVRTDPPPPPPPPSALNARLWPWGTLFLLNRNHKSIKQILKRKCNGRNNENRMLPGRRASFQHSHSFSNMSLLDIKPIKEGSAQHCLSPHMDMPRVCLVSRMPRPPLKVTESCFFFAASKDPDWTWRTFRLLYVLGSRTACQKYQRVQPQTCL